MPEHLRQRIVGLRGLGRRRVEWNGATCVHMGMPASDVSHRNRTSTVRPLATLAALSALGGCAYDVEFRPIASAPPGLRVRHGAEVMVIDRRPSRPHRVIGEISWREVWYDDRALAKLRAEAGAHACEALLLPSGRGEWAQCIVFED